MTVELATAVCRPGDELAGTFAVPGGLPPDARTVELSVLWEATSQAAPTVVLYRDLGGGGLGTLRELADPQPFAVRLPAAPWSYAGRLVTIGWLARVRVRCGGDGRLREVVREAPFIVSPTGRLLTPVPG